MKTRKLFFLMLALVLVLCALAALPFTALAEDGPVIVMGTDKITAGNTIYFGEFDYGTYDSALDSGPIPWRVLSDGNDSRLPASRTGEALLISKECLCSLSFDADYPQHGNLWAGSSAQQWCQSLFNSFAEGGAERKAIKLTQATENDNYVGGHSNYSYGPASLNDHFFFLSAKEADTYFTDDDDRTTGSFNAVYAGWWLRSPVREFAASSPLYDRYAASVSMFGEVYSCDVSSWDGMRPAFNLDLSRVLFVSAAYDGKPGAEGTVSKIETESDAEWKLTLKDESRKFSASVSSVTGPAGGKILIPYVNAKTGSNEYVSVIVFSGSEPLYYGSAKASMSGTAEFTLPSDMPNGSYLLKVFNEQKNKNYMSDVASAFVEIALKVEGSAFPAAFSDSTGSYAIADGAASFEKPAKDSASANIPASVTVNGTSVPVTKIADSAFKGQKNLTKVTLGANINEIGKNAFANCAKLKTVSGGANL